MLNIINENAINDKNFGDRGKFPPRAKMRKAFVAFVDKASA